MPLLAAAAALLWQVTPIVVLSQGDPVLCGYRYRHPDGWALSVEKGIAPDGSVFTAVAVDGALKLRLQTTSFDSDRDLPTGADASRRQGNLEQVDAGGLLFFELGVSGGGLAVDRGDGARSFDLPAPLARDLTATYLNCAGDLIRPDGPDQPENTH